MKLRKLITFTLLAATTAAATAAVPTVKFETLGNKADSEGRYYIQRLTVDNADGIERLCFNEFARKMRTIDKADTVAELIPGYYYVSTPRFDGATGPVAIDIRVRGTLSNHCYIPSGFHAVMKSGEVVPVKAERGTLLLSPEMRTDGKHDNLIYGDSIYRLNNSLADNEKLSPYDVIPSFKSVELTKGKFTKGMPVKTRTVKAENSEYYSIEITGKGAVIEGASPRAIKTGERVLDNLLADNGGTLPGAVIKDWPDYGYRGVMIDIARNYQTPESMKHLTELMADYRFNTLHFHIVDDEAWRLEIPGLPELTDVGSRRGYTTDEHDFLSQIFDGDGNPDSKNGSANGYYTRREFIDFLRHCDALGIDVIPEIESPGHARAAIKAMEARKRRTGDTTYRLIEDGDTSKYSGAQAFRDNIMNPALPGPYKFMDKVIDELAAMYSEAGVELKGVHIGGDEVPEGAWDGSPSAMAMARELNVNGRHGIQGEFVRRIAAMMKGKGIPMYGWQEIGTGYDEAFNKDVAPTVGGVNCWKNTLPGDRNVALKAVKAGYPVILSNVDYFYLDMLYTDHPEERGLSWGGIVDEFKTLNGYATAMCPTDNPELKKLILGVQGQLFSETIRSYPMLQSFLLPKMLGLAERGWNVEPTYSNARFNHIISERVLPRLASEGVNFHVRQPGVTVENGMVKMNSPYEGAVIRYTLDGSEPTEKSAVYSKPFKAGSEKEIRARMWYLGKPSVTTLLYR